MGHEIQQQQLSSAPLYTSTDVAIGGVHDWEK
jgi:hypothetical protein